MTCNTAFALTFAVQCETQEVSKLNIGKQKLIEKLYCTIYPGCNNNISVFMIMSLIYSLKVVWGSVVQSDSIC